LLSPLYFFKRIRRKPWFLCWGFLNTSVSLISKKHLCTITIGRVAFIWTWHGNSSLV
jgi:hypothetical protein